MNLKQLFRAGWQEAKADLIAFLVSGTTVIAGVGLITAGFLAGTAYEGEIRGAFQLLREGDPGLLTVYSVIGAGLFFLAGAVWIFTFLPRSLRLWMQKSG